MIGTIYWEPYYIKYIAMSHIIHNELAAACVSCPRIAFRLQGNRPNVFFLIRRKCYSVRLPSANFSHEFISIAL